jgi:hypothetical protein
MEEFRQYSTDGGQTWHPPLPQRPEPDQPESGERLPVSDEAWAAVVEENGYRTWEVTAAVEAAAPHIARAAKVQVLREIADELGSPDDAHFASFLRQRATELGSP